MPSLNSYKNMFVGARTNGQLRKKQSDMIMDQTWTQDDQARVGYLFDWYKDLSPRKLRDLDPTESRDYIPIDIKFIQHTSQTMDKDAITFHIQFRPGQECNVPYYQKYVDWYEQEFPLGLYILIPDERGRFNKWLIVAKANFYNVQFPTYEVLPCDYCFQYIMDNEKVEVSGVLRSQNSYNRLVLHNPEMDQ